MKSLIVTIIFISIPLLISTDSYAIDYGYDFTNATINCYNINFAYENTRAIDNPALLALLQAPGVSFGFYNRPNNSNHGSLSLSYPLPNSHVLRLRFGLANSINTNSSVKGDAALVYALNLGEKYHYDRFKFVRNTSLGASFELAENSGNNQSDFQVILGITTEIVPGLLFSSKVGNFPVYFDVVEPLTWEKIRKNSHSGVIVDLQKISAPYYALKGIILYSSVDWYDGGLNGGIQLNFLENFFINGDISGDEASIGLGLKYNWVRIDYEFRERHDELSYEKTSSISSTIYLEKLLAPLTDKKYDRYKLLLKSLEEQRSSAEQYIEETGEKIIDE